MIFAELISLKMYQRNQFSNLLLEIFGIDSKSQFNFILRKDF